MTEAGARGLPLDDAEEAEKEAGRVSKIPVVPQGAPWTTVERVMYERRSIRRFRRTCSGDCSRLPGSACTFVGRTLACPANVLEQFGPRGAKKVRVKADHRGCISCNNCHAICENGAIQATQSYDFVGYYRRFGLGEFTKPRVF